MLLLQFSTSHYCRKARLALGYKQIDYRVENLTPGLHILKVKPLTGLTTLPVLLPEITGQPDSIGDSTRILDYLSEYCPEPSYQLADPVLQNEAVLLEDWLDESIGTATRFLYYDFRAGAGKSIDPSLMSQLVINIVRKQYDINPAKVSLAADRLAKALVILGERWQSHQYLVGDQFSIADIAAAALCSPLALIPAYYAKYPWLWERIKHIHHICHEPLPPGLS